MTTQITRRSVPSVDFSWPDHLPARLQAIYASRGVSNSKQLERSLQYLLKPQQLKGLDAALSLLLDALVQQKRMLIVGDFDADGATSSALAMLALRDMGAEHVNYLVPNRFEFGYGLTPEIVEVAKGYQPDLIITVDNGISSLDGVKAAQAVGIEVLVTDHHLPGQQLPSAEAIVNPNQPECSFPSKNLAGVGVIFYLMSALRTALRDMGWFQELGRSEPNMASYLDLVALGTVADVVPLDANNRILVYQGLQRIRAGRARPGILALLDVSGRQPQRLVASDLGFTVGPRLNAAGRLDDMSLGIECLLCDRPELAREMAVELDDLNRDRRAIEAGMQQEALAALAELSLADEQIPWGICLFDARWHQGVIGILASRIKERYHRPVIAFAEAGNGEIKGSARSIPGFHIRDALDAVAAKHPELLSKFGGHAMAAGLSLAAENLPAFQIAFDQIVHDSLNESDLRALVFSDGELVSTDFTLELAHNLRDAGPWGQHFPEPAFDGVFNLVKQRIVGEKHLKMVVSCEDNPSQLLDAIAFNVDLELWPNMQAQRIQLAYRLDVNEFRGKQSVQLMVEHLNVV